MQIAPPNCRWHTFLEKSDTVIIFVHGFLANSNDCWMSQEKIFWPDLLAAEHSIKDVSIFLAGYHTSVDSEDYGIADCANELKASLTMKQADGSRAPMDFSNVIFVCHSLGGIVTRYFLEASPTLLSDKSIGLILFASPALGSNYANGLSGIASFFRNEIGKNLQLNSSLLTDIDHRFKIFLEKPKNFQIVGCEFIETKGYLHRKIFSFLPTVVNKASAARYFGNPIRIPQSNHSTIVKPNERNHPSHRHLVNFLLEKFQTIRQPFPSEQEKKADNKTESLTFPVRTLISRVLFDVYDPTCASYYFVRPIDNHTADLIQFYSIWLCGPSGAGKTSIIKRLLDQSKNKPIELSLSHCSSTLSGETCLSEISDTCLQLEIGNLQKASSRLPWLIETLANYSKTSSVVLYVDEVPVGDPCTPNFISFCRFLADLLTAVKQKSGPGTHFIISSIGKPVFQNHPKIIEQVTLLEIPYWTEDELDGLLSLICSNIPNLNFTPIFINQLLEKCQGSPRFLKTFFKNKLVSALSLKTDTEILQFTVEQFDW
jgi:pimeloyl-ACP methyl ester carboxylesterase